VVILDRPVNSEKTMTTPALITTAQELLGCEPAVQFAYLFGSWARGNPGPLSDLDLAVFIDRRRNPFKFRLMLMEKLARAIRSDNFDLVILNDAPLVLQYEVIRGGKILKEQRQRRVVYEARVLRDFLDTENLRRVHREALKRSLLGH
jgi:hypothetical protein